jgi:hypothetical protein
MFDELDGFIWDKGNYLKNLVKHNITCQESEEVFFDENQIIIKDELHSVSEQRRLIIGKTHNDILLSVVFTVRNNKIRIISARRAPIKERRLYEK